MEFVEGRSILFFGNVLIIKTVFLQGTRNLRLVIRSGVKLKLLKEIISLIVVRSLTNFLSHVFVKHFPSAANEKSENIRRRYVFVKVVDLVEREGEGQLSHTGNGGILRTTRGRSGRKKERKQAGRMW